MNKVLTAALAASVAVSALSTAAFAEGKKNWCFLVKFPRGTLEN